MFFEAMVLKQASWIWYATFHCLVESHGNCLLLFLRLNRRITLHSLACHWITKCPLLIFLTRFSRGFNNKFWWSGSQLLLILDIVLRVHCLSVIVGSFEVTKQKLWHFYRFSGRFHLLWCWEFSSENINSCQSKLCNSLFVFWPFN